MLRQSGQLQVVEVPNGLSRQKHTNEEEEEVVQGGVVVEQV
jgi:hypothetical protein